MTDEPPDLGIDRRALMAAAAGSGAALALGATGAAGAVARMEPDMKIACLIRYQIDPFQREAFQTYAQAWGPIIPRCGGRLLGYFLPWVGTNDIGWGMIGFEDLTAYDVYRKRLLADPEARANFEFARRQRVILREERNFVELVPGTLDRPPTG